MKLRLSRFEIRAKGGVESELKTALEAKAERRMIRKDEVRTGEEMA